LTNSQNLIELLTHYGRKFDIPFTRTRALIDKVAFPHFGIIVNDDVFYWARYKLKLNSNRLDTVVKTLTGHSEKTHLDAEIWIPAGMGDTDCIAKVLEHNIIDVEELEKNILF